MPYSTDTKSNAEDSRKKSMLKNQWPTTGDTCLSTAGVRLPPLQLSNEIFYSKGDTTSNDTSIMTSKISEVKEGKVGEVNKLKLYLGICLMNGIHASSMRKKEEAASSLRFTSTVSLVVPSIKGMDFTLKVTLSKSFGESILDIIISAQHLHHLFGDFIFRAIIDSRAICKAR